MLNTLVFSINAILPLFVLIMLGYAIRRAGFFTDETLEQLNRFNFRFPFCALMFLNIYNMDLSQGIPVRLALLSLLVLLILTLIGLLIAQFVTKERDRKGIITQAMYRPEYSIIALPLATTLAGTAGQTMATIFQLPVTVYLNFSCVILLSIYSRTERKVRIGDILIGIAKNPLIQGLLAGAVAVLIRQLIPVGADGLPVFSIQYSLPWLYQVLSYVSRIALPLSLIVLGAQMRFSDTGRFRKELTAGVLMKLVGAPVVGLGLMFLFARAGLVTLGKTELGVMIALFGAPMSISSVIMAAQMNADDRLNGQIVAWTSLLGMVSLFALIMIFRTRGLI